MRVCTGDQVRVHYRIISVDKRVFDHPGGGQELDLHVGNGPDMLGLQHALLGMHPGERKSLSLSPEEGFGRHDPQRAYRLRRSDLPADVQIGDCVRGQEGDAIVPVWVVTLDDEAAVVDANHPLAGQMIGMEIELLSINS